MANFISELKKRKVFSSSAIYLGTAFVILQVAQVLVPALNIPDWTNSFIVVLLMLGFPVVLILSWIFDISEGHIVKTVTEKSSEDDNLADDTKPALGYSKSIVFGIMITTILSVTLIYEGVDYATSLSKVDDKVSIAVLPFKNIRKLPEYEWLGDYLAGNLTFKLGQISTIRMIDRLKILNELSVIDPEQASILDVKIKQIAENVDVNLIMYGNYTILSEINSIEITVYLTNIKTGIQTSVMQETYPLDDLPNIPSKINKFISTFIKNNKMFKSGNISS